MSFGNMNTPVEIMKRVIETDDEGFKNERMKTVASVRAYREGRDGSTGGFFADSTNASAQVWNTVNLLLRLDRNWKV